MGRESEKKSIFPAAILSGGNYFLFGTTGVKIVLASR